MQDDFEAWTSISRRMSIKRHGLRVHRKPSRFAPWRSQVGLLAIAGWSGIILGCFFMGMKKIGFLRVSEECEDLGLDAKEFSPARPYSH